MTADPALRLKRGHDRARVHPWIFKGDVADVSDVAPGTAVTVVDASARFVGRGFYNPRPALCCRILTRRDEPLDVAFFRSRLEAALRRSGRSGAMTSSLVTAGRLVWSEADMLPGLVVDRYGAVLVLQCQTLGMARVRPLLVAALRSLLGDWPVLNADEVAPAALEGFAPARGWLDRPGPADVIVDEGIARLRVSLGAGHKTGLYLDQAENRRRAASLARESRRARRLRVHGRLRLPRAPRWGAAGGLPGIVAGGHRGGRREPRAQWVGGARRDTRG